MVDSLSDPIELDALHSRSPWSSWSTLFMVIVLLMVTERSVSLSLTSVLECLTIFILFRYHSTTIGSGNPSTIHSRTTLSPNVWLSYGCTRLCDVMLTGSEEKRTSEDIQIINIVQNELLINLSMIIIIWCYHKSIIRYLIKITLHTNRCHSFKACANEVFCIHIYFLNYS